MNSWLKLALYAFIGAIMGSFLLGIISTGNGLGINSGMNYGSNGGYMNSYDYIEYGAQSHMNMNGGMMHGGMGMRNGMGMMRR